MNRVLMLVVALFQLAVLAHILWPPNPCSDYIISAIVMAFNGWFWVKIIRGAPAKPETAQPVRHSISAYLVVTLNTRVQPPHVTRVEIFSVSAQSLTITGSGQAHLDLYEVSADNYRQAKNELLRTAPRIWPWVRPFLVNETLGISDDE